MNNPTVQFEVQLSVIIKIKKQNLCLNQQFSFNLSEFIKYSLLAACGLIKKQLFKKSRWPFDKMHIFRKTRLPMDKKQRFKKSRFKHSYGKPLL